MVVLVSPNTHKSEWVDWEIEYAHTKCSGTRIVGVKWTHGAQGCDLPHFAR
ncbi:MAG: TIR domain-containing protein [Hyphomicrobiales bacterium]